MDEIIFESIEIINFKCHEKMEYYFTPNKFSLITGPNGSGKTTIADGLSWALYDKTTKGLGGDSVVRKRSNKDCSVIVKFSKNNDYYVIENYRKHHKNNNAKKLFKNNKEITGVNVDATNALISQIVMPREVFINCLLFSQFIKKNASFTALGPSGQRDIIDSMLLFNKFDIYKEKISKRQNVVETEIAALTESLPYITSNIEMLNKYLQEKEAYLIQLEKDIVTNEKNSKIEIQELKDNIITLNSKIKLFSKAEKTLQNLREKHTQLKSKVQSQVEACTTELKSSTAQKNIDILNIKSNISNKYNDNYKNINTKINDIKKDIADIINKKDNISLSTKNTIHEQIEKVQIENLPNQKKLQDTIHSIKNDINNLIELINKNIIDYNQLKLDIKNFEENLNENICPTCKETPTSQKYIKENLEEKKKSLKNLEIKIKNFKADQNNKTKLLKQTEDALVSFDTEYKQSIEKINIDLNKKESDQLIILNNQNFNLTLDLTDYQDKLNQLESMQSQEETTQINSIEQNYEKIYNEIKNKHKTIAQEWTSEIKELELSIENEDIKYQQYLKLNQDVAVCQSKLVTTTDNFEIFRDKTRETISETKLQIHNNKNEIKQEARKETQKKEKIPTLNEELEILKFWKKAFGDSGIKSILMDEAIPILNKRAIELCSQANHLRISFDSQKTLKSGDQRNKFSINVIQTQNLSELDELSAGEERMVNIIILLCLRHLLETMQNTKMNIIFLDEILDSLDPQNCVIVLDILRELSKDYCVTLISHTLKDNIESDECLKM